MTSVAEMAENLSDRTPIARPRILVADPIAHDGLGVLQAMGDVDVASGLGPGELALRIAICDALVVRSETKVNAELMAAAPRLRVIGRAGVGVDNIDVEAATDRGILVLNSPEGNTIAAAEHVVAMLFALMRNIPRADRSMHEGGWDRKRFVGQELRGKTLGILGLGKVGSEVARIASAGVGMRVLAHDPIATPARAERVSARLVDFSALLGESDILTVHVPLSEETRGLIGREELAAMKAGARVVNVARGGIVDESALIEAIESGHIAGAAIDVFVEEPLPLEHPLRKLDQLILTPHLGASTEEAQVNVSRDVAEQISVYLSGGMPEHPVNAPAIRSEEMEQLRPYLDLTSRMGSLVAQLCPTQLDRIAFSYAGDVARLKTEVLTTEILSRLLARFSDARVNAVNAKRVSIGLGLEIDERTTTKASDLSEAIVVEARGAENLVVAGTQIEGQPRITRLNEFRLDMRPEGTFLVVRHEDRPGVIATISSLLAEADINIARIELGRDRPRGQAMMLMEVDDPVSPELLATMRLKAGLQSLRVIHL